MTVASRELLLLFGIGVLRAAVELVGVFDRAAGALLDVGGMLCCRDVRPLDAVRRAPAGELERVDAGLVALDGVVSFLFMTGNREEPEG